MRTLALDISTAATGWAVFDGDKLLDYGVVKVLDSLDHSARGYYVSLTIEAVIQTYKPNECVIEDTFFSKNALILKKLCWISGQLQHVWFKHSGKGVHLYSALTVRSTFPGLKGNSEKEEIIAAVNKQFLSRKKVSNQISDNNIADAIVLGHHYIITKGAADPNAEVDTEDNPGTVTVTTSLTTEGNVDTKFHQNTSSTKFSDPFRKPREKKKK